MNDLALLQNNQEYLQCQADAVNQIRAELQQRQSYSPRIIIARRDGFRHCRMSAVANVVRADEIVGFVDLPAQDYVRSAISAVQSKRAAFACTVKHSG